MTILTATARLFDISMIYFRNRTGNGFAVGNTRLVNIALNAKLAQHAVNEDIKMQFTQDGNDYLACVFIRTNAEGWILFRRFSGSFGHLFLISVALRLNRN